MVTNHTNDNIVAYEIKKDKYTSTSQQYEKQYFHGKCKSKMLNGMINGYTD